LQRKIVSFAQGRLRRWRKFRSCSRSNGVHNRVPV
jgi:hypothetical protein